MKICLIDETGTGDGALSVLAARWGLEHDEDNLMALVLTPEHLELRKRDEPKLGGIFVDFVGGAMAHRRKFGGGRGEAVAKAVGIKGDYLPDVVDATAGLGRDAFVLASVGCRVRMLERNPVVAALLDDGGAWLCGCGNRRLVAGAVAVNSRLQPDGADRYYPTPAGGLSRSDVPA
ncbi:hypothetical protein ECZU23_42100 [Escherichia coli]|nr:hypothetical protein ECZU20_14340 [Escherichia coli]GHL15767.1 hypothetical protein ECZU23_42100 [Escherichia coli]GHL30130.1 hypothetical protein ECZU26_09550 [Escherichia coli]